jgi:hypothetical protein
VGAPQTSTFGDGVGEGGGVGFGTSLIGMYVSICHGCNVYHDVATTSKRVPEKRWESEVEFAVLYSFTELQPSILVRFRK